MVRTIFSLVRNRIFPIFRNEGHDLVAGPATTLPTTTQLVNESGIAHGLIAELCSRHARRGEEGFDLGQDRVRIDVARHAPKLLGIGLCVNPYF